MKLVADLRRASEPLHGSEDDLSADKDTLRQLYEKAKRPDLMKRVALKSSGSAE